MTGEDHDQLQTFRCGACSLRASSRRPPRRSRRSTSPAPLRSIIRTSRSIRIMPASARRPPFVRQRCAGATCRPRMQHDGSVHAPSGCMKHRLRRSFSPASCRVGMRPAEVRRCGILADLDNAAADGAGAGEMLEQRLAVAAADRPGQFGEVLVEGAEHLQHGLLVVEEHVAPHRRVRRRDQGHGGCPGGKGRTAARTARRRSAAAPPPEPRPQTDSGNHHDVAAPSVAPWARKLSRSRATPWCTAAPPIQPAEQPRQSTPCTGTLPGVPPPSSSRMASREAPPGTS